MNKEQIDELKELLYEENWYIDTKWSDPSQKANAQRVHQRMLAIVTGGAYVPPNPVPDIEPPEPPADAGSNIPVKVFPYPRAKWAFSGDTFPAVIVGLTPEEFRGYVQWVRKHEKYSWAPNGITAHHTAWPNLDAPSHWKNGWTEQLIKNARAGYIRDRGFKHGPHLFTDQNRIWIMNPLSIRGTHATSFNSHRYGVEMLLDGEDASQIASEKGQKSIRMGQVACAILMKDGGISTDRLNFHRHDPETSKSCPGSKIEFGAFEAAVLAIHAGLK